MQKTLDWREFCSVLCEYLSVDLILKFKYKFYEELLHNIHIHVEQIKLKLLNTEY